MPFALWESYKIFPLNHPKDIRFVVLHPKDTRSRLNPVENDISIDIELARLDHCKYGALLYTWVDKGTPIEIEVGHNFKSLLITESLHIALKYLQGSHKRIFWIDALCP